jgi:predicted phage terminase large subunit-like protein
MILEPPRHGKSELTSRRLPAYLHGKFQDAEILAASYSASLANDMTADVQRIMDSPEYQHIFPGTKIPAPGTRHPVSVRNSEEYDVIGTRGKYRGQGVGGSFTGKGGRFLLIDDPIKGRLEADSVAFRESLWKWYTSDLRSRLAPGGGILLTQTCWHEDDLAGRLLKLAKENPSADQWTVLRLPAIREDLSDPQDLRELGEALWPKQYSLTDLESIKASDSRGFSALYQQRPTALEGSIIKHSWIKHYDKRPEKFSKMIQSWDLTFKDAKNSDYVVGQVWGVHEGKRYLVDQIRERMGFGETCRAIMLMSTRWPEANRKLIEEKANGAAVIETLKRQGITGIIPVIPRESKDARLSAVSTYYEAGDVLYPSTSLASWISINIDEITSFPNAANDDTVDATSQALNDLAGTTRPGPRVTAL